MVIVMVIGLAIMIAGVFFTMLGPVDKVWVGAGAMIFGAILALVFAFLGDNERKEACANVGGVIVKTTCIDKNAVIELDN